MFRIIRRYDENINIAVFGRGAISIRTEQVYTSCRHELQYRVPYGGYIGFGFHSKYDKEPQKYIFFCKTKIFFPKNQQKLKETLLIFVSYNKIYIKIKTIFYIEIKLKIKKNG